ncbi:MAG: DUF697 domain-containing protein [Prochlorothrix sp.]
MVSSPFDSAPTSQSLLAQTQHHLHSLLQRYQTQTRSTQAQTSPSLGAGYQGQIDRLSTLVHKLEQRIVTIAVFGLVSRGKSAVLNGLLGQKLLETGPINGVTRWPQTLRWTATPLGRFQVDLIDTPGLDEIDGQNRTDMAQTVAQQADLILFVVAGDLTRTEYGAIQRLLRFQKPLLLVFNKTDLYPLADREQILEQLRQFLLDQGETGTSLALSTADVLPVAAEPAPLQVRIEAADGTVTQTWETPEPQMGELADRLTQILRQEGEQLLALNALVQARSAEETLAQAQITTAQDQAERRINQMVWAKAGSIALCPLWLGDLAAGAVVDLVMVRMLAQRYALPMTRYRVGQLWQRWLASGAVLLLAEGLSQGFIGLGGGTGDLTAWGGAGLLQGLAAAYGGYQVSRSAQVYLREGCTWGPEGASPLIEAILEQAKPEGVVARLRIAQSRGTESQDT